MDINIGVIGNTENNMVKEKNTFVLMNGLREFRMAEV
jgi:hypothetical protein